jgi:hypothetical protein
VLAPGAGRALASGDELLVASLGRDVAAGAPAADDSLADPALPDPALPDSEDADAALPDSEDADAALPDSEDAFAAVALAASEVPAAD